MPPYVQDFFLISDLNLPSFSSNPFPLVLSLQVLVKSPPPAPCRPPLGTGMLLEGLQEPSKGCAASIISACLHSRGIPALWSTSWLSSGLAWTGSCPFCVVSPRAEGRTPHGVSQGRITSLDCWLLFGCSWLPGLQVHVASSCWASHESTLPGLSYLGCIKYCQLGLWGALLSTYMFFSLEFRFRAEGNVWQLHHKLVRIDIKSHLELIHLPFQGSPSIFVWTWLCYPSASLAKVSV